MNNNITYYRKQILLKHNFNTWDEYLDYKKKNNKTCNLREYVAKRKGFKDLADYEIYLKNKKENSKNNNYILNRRKKIQYFNSIKDGLIIHPIHTKYGVDKDSNIWSFKRHKILSQCFNYVNGYMYVNIDKITYSVHKFVFECHCGVQKFSTKYAKGLTINHKDGDKLNNKFYNLELLTKHDNVRLNNSNKCPYGISFNKNDKIFYVQFTRNNIHYTPKIIGEKIAYKTIEEALIMRDKLLKYLNRL